MWIHRFSRFFWLLLFDLCMGSRPLSLSSKYEVIYFIEKLVRIMIFSVRRPQYFISHTKSQRLLVTWHRLSCEKVNLHNTLVTWAWEACGVPCHIYLAIVNFRVERSDDRKYVCAHRLCHIQVLVFWKSCNEIVSKRIKMQSDLWIKTCSIAIR